MRRFFNTPTVILLVLLVALNFFNGSFTDPLSWLVAKLLMLPGIVIGLTFHEFAHGAVSYALGDPTPKLQGRLTLNPLAHFEPIGFVSLLIAGFGWGVPVEVDNRYYKRPRLDEFLVSIAGVAMNFLIALLFTFVLKLCVNAGVGLDGSGFGYYMLVIIQNIISINIVLMVFNLLPIPPLDGFGIITQIFNLRQYDWYYTLYRNGLPILLICIVLGLTRMILNPATQGIYSLLLNIVGIT